MSFQWMAEAVKVDLPAPKKCLLLMMANYADENATMYASYERLALDAGLSTRTVKRYIKEFERLGQVKVHRQRISATQHDRNHYTLLLLLAQANGGSDRVSQGSDRECKGVVSEKVTSSDTVSHNTINKPIKNNLSLVEQGILNFLNERTGRSFTTAPGLKSRLTKHTVDDVKLVIEFKAREWLPQPKMRQYLRPETLFGNKFEGYLNDARDRIEFDQDLDGWAAGESSDGFTIDSTAERVTE